MMDNKPAVRIQTSILNRIEKKILIWIAERLPRWITSDNLTVIGLIGALVSGVGYVLSNSNPAFLWLASLGLIINWFGDSLDGTVARVRNTQRPLYGFFIDHNVDGITILMICAGAGLSPYFSLSVTLLILAGYYLLSIFTYINTHLKGEFRISYNGLGPTELRLVIIGINTLLMYLPTTNNSITIVDVALNLYDIIAIVVAFILFILYIVSFLKERKYYAAIDPPHLK